jgi:hypothetical protein
MAMASSIPEQLHRYAERISAEQELLLDVFSAA